MSLLKKLKKFLVSNNSSSLILHGHKQNVLVTKYIGCKTYRQQNVQHRRQKVSVAKRIGGKTYRQENKAIEYGGRIYQWQNIAAAKCIGGKRTTY